jgi:hypothetical protein
MTMRVMLLLCLHRCLCNANHMRFRKVFGYKRCGGEPVLAQRVLLDFCDQFPSGSEKKGTKRGANFSCTNYVHNSGSRRAKRAKRVRPKMDYEFFITEMQTKRNWSAAKADSVWKELDAVEANFADNAGPQPFSRRLRIPTNLVCGECSESEDENFEERYASTTGGKPSKNLSEEERTKLVSEMKMGFSKLESAAPASQFTRVVPVSAMSFTGEASSATGVSALLAVAGAAAGPPAPREAEPFASPVKSSGVHDLKSSPTKESATKESAKKSEEIFDLSSARSSMLSTTSANAKLLENKITARVKEMAKVMAQTPEERQCSSSFQTAAGRLELGLLWMSKMAVQKAKEGVTGLVADYDDMVDFDHNMQAMLLFQFSWNESNLSKNDCLGLSHV